MKQHMQKSRALFLTLLASTCLMNAEKVVISSYADFQKLKESNKDAIVKVSAEWCGACKMIKDAFDEVANDPSLDHVVFAYVDADKNGEVTHRETVTGLPTFIYLANGKEVDRQVGVNNPNAFASDLKNKLASAKHVQGSVHAAIDAKLEEKAEEKTEVKPAAVPETTVKEEVKEAVKNVQEEAKKVAHATEEEASGLLEKLKALFAWVFVSIKDLLVSIVNWFKGLFGK